MGQAEAFEILFRRHSARVLGYLARRMALPKDAPDLLQDVFLKLHRFKHLYNRTLPFSPWLFSITRSVLLDSVKKRREEMPVDRQDLEQTPAPELLKYEGPNVMASLEDLPAAQRQAISLRYCDESTFEEIATRLGTTPENARQLVSRGLKSLRATWGAKKDRA